MIDLTKIKYHIDTGSPRGYVIGELHKELGMHPDDIGRDIDAYVSSGALAECKVDTAEYSKGFLVSADWSPNTAKLIQLANLMGRDENTQVDLVFDGVKYENVKIVSGPTSSFSEDSGIVQEGQFVYVTRKVPDAS